MKVSNMKIIKNVLKNEINIRTEKNYPIEGIEFIDITPLILQKETLKEITEKFVEYLKEKEIDYIVAPEARGFLFGTTVANTLNVGCIPVRKKGKLPPTTVEMQFEYEKEYGKDILELPKLVNQSYENKKFYILQDKFDIGTNWEICLDKETGLPLKEINMNGLRSYYSDNKEKNIDENEIESYLNQKQDILINSSDSITEYKYEFDMVTDEDVKMPDLSEYEIERKEN